MQIGVKEQRSDGSSSSSVSLILCLPPYLGDGRRAAVSRNCSQFTAFQRLQLNQDAAPLLRIFARATSGKDDPAGVSVSRSFVSHQVREGIEKGKTARAAAMPPERMERETGRERGRGKGVVFGPLGHWATMPTRLQ